VESSPLLSSLAPTGTGQQKSGAADNVLLPAWLIFPYSPLHFSPYTALCSLTHHGSFLEARIAVVPEVSHTERQRQHEEERTASVFLADVESEITDGERERERGREKESGEGDGAVKSRAARHSTS
jgi:hypothetical protein